MIQIDNFSFYNADCLEIMKTFSDKQFDLAIVDPPYGIGEHGQRPNRNERWKNAPKTTKYKKVTWDFEPPTNEYFNELLRVSKNQIVCGANHFISKLPIDSSCWIVWDKKTGGDFADCELAWTSFNTAVRKFDWLWNGFRKQEPEDRIHPTQKPVKLYDFLITQYAKSDFKILDTHLGSASIALAVDKCNVIDNMNLSFTGIELDSDYFNAAISRFKNNRVPAALPFF